MGDYSRRLDRYTDISNGGAVNGAFRIQIAAADSVTVVALAAVSAYTIFVQKILVSVTVDAAQSLTFEDTTGIIIAKTKPSPGLGPIPFDFGPDGYPLTESAGLQIVISGAGLAASVSLTAYSVNTNANLGS